MEIINILLHPDILLNGLNPIVAYAVIFLMVFAESGLLFGFFLPGDSLLFLAGFLSNQLSNGTQLFDLPILIIILCIAAVLGDNVGYYTGEKWGVKLYNVKDNFIFKQRYLTLAKRYYDKRAATAIILARFLPAIRTFAPIVAGIVGLEYKTFFKYNLIGGVAWVTIMTMLGFYLGKFLDSQNINIETVLVPVVVIILGISIGMALWESRHTKEVEEEVLES